MAKAGTIIRMDNDKKKILKATASQKGLSMNEFILEAIDIALSVETKETIQLSRDKELLEHELKSLEENKEIYLKNYHENKELLEYKIKQVDSAIDNLNGEIEEKSENDDYNNLVNMVYGGRKIDSITDMISDHADKYNVDFDELKKQIIRDVEKKKFMK